MNDTPAELLLERVDPQQGVISIAGVPASHVVGGRTQFSEPHDVVPVKKTIDPADPVPLCRIRLKPEQ